MSQGYDEPFSGVGVLLVGPFHLGFASGPPLSLHTAYISEVVLVDQVPGKRLGMVT